MPNTEIFVPQPMYLREVLYPKKGTLFKMFLYGYIYILINFQNNRFPYDFLKVVSVRHLSSTFSSLVSSHPQLHLILLTFLVFIKFFTDKEKRYFSFSFFTFILCLARLLKVLSELKVFQWHLYDFYVQYCTILNKVYLTIFFSIYSPFYFFLLSYCPC